MWYVIQTETGHEEEVLLMIEKILPPAFYKKCFIMKAEWMKRLGGIWQIQVRPLFPGYVFVETEKPEQLFMELKQIPKLTKILGDGSFDFIPMEPEEEVFFKTLLGEHEDTVKLTEMAVSEEGEIISIHGALEYLKEDILQMNLHKRYVIVKVSMLKKEKTMILGIRLVKDAGVA